jgi:hypothetical protein
MHKNPYYYYEGVRLLARQFRGDENIYLGIRPYGFHAGNLLTLVFYPMLLCEELKKLGKTPRFNFFVFINDWEQDELDGLDPKKYPFNIYPKNTTLQYLNNHLGGKVLDIWFPVINSHVSIIQKSYPDTHIELVKNSDLKHNPRMKYYLLETIKRPEELGNLFQKNSEHVVLDSPRSYAMAVCPVCQKSRGFSRVSISKGKDYIVHKCEICKHEIVEDYEYFDYWFYHKPLAIPRLEIFKIDLCITGSDHLKEKDFGIRNELIRFFGAKIKPFKTLYAPLVLGPDGNKMGKSHKNCILPEVDAFSNFFYKNIDKSFLSVSK